MVDLSCQQWSKFGPSVRDDYAEPRDFGGRSNPAGLTEVGASEFQGRRRASDQEPRFQPAAMATMATPPWQMKSMQSACRRSGKGASATLPETVWLLSAITRTDWWSASGEAVGVGPAP